MSDKTCAACGASLTGRRSDARFCNGSCSREWHRRMAKLDGRDPNAFYWRTGHWVRKPRRTALAVAV